MIKRRKQILDWLVDNMIDEWPGPFGDGIDLEEIAAEWTSQQSLSSLPVVRCKLGGTGQITALDYFYHKKKPASSNDGIQGLERSDSPAGMEG